MQANESRLKIVIAKKEAIFAHINSLYDMSRGISVKGKDTRSTEEFVAASSHLDRLYNDFNTLCDEHNELLLMIDPTKEINFNNWASFETLVAKIQHTRSSLLTARREVSPARGRRDSGLSRLPPLELKGFSGEPETWPLFYQNFKSAVHDNTELTDAQRVQYLIGKLSGKALNVFAGIIPNEANYNTIWESLVTRYQDTRMLGSMYINNITGIKVTPTSVESLHTFIENVHASIFALKQLGIDNLADFILTHIVVKKLDLCLMQAFELSLRDKKVPTSDDLIEFLRHHVKVLERTGVPSLKIHSRESNPIPRAKPAAPKVSHSFTVTNNGDKLRTHKCVYCKSVHAGRLYECGAFRTARVRERRDFVRNNRLCANCLSAYHTVADCKSVNTCRICRGKHHTLIHIDTPATSGSGQRSNELSKADTSIPRESPSNTGIDNGFITLHARNLMTKSKTTVVLLTAAVFASARDVRVTLRCIVDSASQNNLITLECCHRLNLTVHPLINSTLKSVGSISAPIKGYVNLTIQSRLSDAHYTISMLVVENITDRLPTHEIDSSIVDSFRCLPLADDAWHVSGVIDAILGAEMFGVILLGGKVISPYCNALTADANKPARTAYALETTLGYIIFGEVPTSHRDHTVWSFGPLLNDLSKELTRFWELEEVSPAVVAHPEHLECEDIYKSTVTRHAGGRYTVSLPFKGDPMSLGNSFTHAQRRLTALERRFNALPALRRAYNEVITDYIEKGYLSEIPHSDTAKTDGYFIPHHAVVNPDKTTTKTRIVLDASAKTDTGVSLNDVLHIGPNLQADLFKLLLRFRHFEIAITADIQQMYLRIFVKPEDRKYQKILYRFNDSEPIRIFQFNSVAFGLRSSPYLAMRTVRQLADDERERFPLAARVATQELYMDDLTTSAQTVNDGVTLAKELISLFSAGGFNLVKWASNSSELLSHLPESHRTSIEFADNSDTLKVLGLQWIPTADAFSFRITAVSAGITKRTMLSTIARFFDVLGFAAPVTLHAKLLLRELWSVGVGWDEVPPQPIAEQFIMLRDELPIMAKLRIPRHLGVADGCISRILAFGDASMKAYGCVIYLHVTHPNGDITTRLLCAKSKVAPLKTVTLARLELCAALLLAKLVSHVHPTLNDRYPIEKTFAFSDSTVALCWIHSSPHRWQTFVANRVSKIHELLSPDHFFHIAGEHNPSDCVSRGMLPSQLVNHELWWNGPAWMMRPVSEWPVESFDSSQVEGHIAEMKQSLTFAAVSPVDSFLLLELSQRVSTWKRLLRIVVYVLRFAKILPRSSYIQRSDLAVAERHILGELQRKYFTEEIDAIRKGALPSPGLRKLDLFVDGSGLGSGLGVV